MDDQDRFFRSWTSYRSLLGAWHALKERDPAASVDGVRARVFARTAAVELELLCDALRSGRYVPRPLLGFKQPGPKDRTLVVPALIDRVVQTALLGQVALRTESLLHPDCHGFVKGRSTLTAQRRASGLARLGLRHYAHADVADCFPSVDRSRLHAELVEALGPATACVVGQLIAAPVVLDGARVPAGPKGIPLGQPVSPLCVNLLLTPVDRALERAGVSFVRYGDDFLLLCRTSDERNDALSLLEELLGRVDLRLKAEKTRTGEVPGDAVPFLGRLLAGSEVLEAVLRTGPRPETEPPPPGGHDLPRGRTLYVQTPGVLLRAQGGRVRVCLRGDETASVRLKDIDRVMILAPSTMTSGFVGACLDRGVVVHFAQRLGPFGTLTRTDAEDPLVVRAQIESQSDLAFRVEAARRVLLAKWTSQRDLLVARRAAVALRARHARAAGPLARASEIHELLGLEGAFSAAYFEALASEFTAAGMAFGGRSRRPPRDPVNSLLSFAYTLLLNETHGAIVEAALSPYHGYLHAIRAQHAALASDLIEPYRAGFVDRLVLRLVNRAQFGPSDFFCDEATKGVFLEDGARRRFLEIWEAEMVRPLRPDAEGRPRSVRDCLRLDAFRVKRWLLAIGPAWWPALLDGREP